MGQPCFSFAALLLLAGNAIAQEYTSLGADDCLPCHGEGSPRPAPAIFATPHGARTDPSAPFSGLQCEACHGPSMEHSLRQRSGDNVPPAVVFGQTSVTTVAEQNRVCLGCHDSGPRHAWSGSAHDAAAVSCAACHQIHRPRDRVFDPIAQQEACFGCHPQRRGDTLKASSHPLRFGAMTCSGCHDPHNGDNDFLLAESTVNDTCFTCHAEKRGPFLWEHAPASEDCSLCHRPHGSNHPALLVRRPPLLCQQCHAPGGHPSLAFDAGDADDSRTNRFLLGRGCLNCHSQVHGSNHPSGATLHR